MPTDAFNTWLADALGVDIASILANAQGSQSNVSGQIATTATTTAPPGAPATAPATASPATPAAPAPSPVADDHAEIGSLSARFEAGNRGSTAIGNDSTGGWSYGKYQIATKTGTMKNFLDYLQTADPAAYQKLTAAGGAKGAKDHTAEFVKAWKDLANDGTLTTAEHGFIEQTHYEPQAEKLDKVGIKLDARSKALQDVAWSTAVQLGPTTNAIKTATTQLIAARKAQEAKNKPPGDTTPPKTDAEIAAELTDEDLIKAVYAERGRTDKDGNLVYFKNSTPEVQKAVAQRFKQECAAALAELKAAKPSSPPANAPGAGTGP